ncbi:initiation factor 2 [Trametes coccinea BRFM310]|uniref:Translation initiation factor IF-2, mitochondrial n=1 Tax=Trametes coccinea (strain BRFM310) TaxID=1353009 RepID=A0A1Y2J876_TRAC3|nr:initiation factor 2 [Trametes coccinea BRFM310]
MHRTHRSLRIARLGVRASSSSAQALPKPLVNGQNGPGISVPRSRSWAQAPQSAASGQSSGAQGSGLNVPQQRKWSSPQPGQSSSKSDLGNFLDRNRSRGTQGRADQTSRSQVRAAGPSSKSTLSRSANGHNKRTGVAKVSSADALGALDNILRDDRIQAASDLLAGERQEQAEPQEQVTEPEEKGKSPVARAWVDTDDDSSLRGLGRSERHKRTQYKERGSLLSRLKDEAVIPKHSRVSNVRSEVKEKEEKKKAPKAIKKVNADVFIPSIITVGNLAKLLNVKLDDLRRKMIRVGMEAEASHDHMLTSDYASLLAMEFNRNPVVNDEAAFDIYPPPPHPDPSTLPARPPIVTIMGHVDHGKTTLLDTLRSTSVAKGEAGGITQHIGAFSVPVPASGSSSEPMRTITFLDTPGHAAFSAMRARGASVTDVVVLVVAADDGIMPQTREVIELVKNSNVSLVVAINKVDKPGVDIQKVENALLAEGIQLEAFGGDIPVVHVSGLTGQGLDQLVETISAVAEMQDLRAEREGVLQGYVLESKVAKGLGPVGTVLVLRGNLKPGQHLICGMASAKVRLLTDHNGKAVKVAYPGMAVTVSGWKELPNAGDEVLTGSEADIKKALTNRLRKAEIEASLEDLEAINEQRRSERERREAEDSEEGIEAPQVDEGPKQLRLIIKGDVSGTVEAVKGSLAGIGNDLAKVKVVSTGVGEVTESDVLRAKTAGGVIIAFNVKVPRSVENEAQSQHVPILASSVIYKLIDDVKARVIDLLPPIIEKRVSGEATVLQLFDIHLKGKKTKQVGGCRVTNGVVSRNKLARVVRNGNVIHEGQLETLKQHKNDVMEISKGNECGLNLADFNDLRVGDVVEIFEEVKLPGKL